ncbi:MAG: stage V sporulation protein AD [Defluviitaleaceae bacterium]|nr:stage V sporulation protein AD [Defluviitaleaceae bacterium]MCL2240532.1 stage V sporulation protein AD [Defluviitaleaceae bacterium]
MKKFLGAQTVRFSQPPTIKAAASIVGPKEGEGPLWQSFDVISPDVLFGMDSWEKAESEMARQTVALAAQKAGLPMEEIRYILAGDLLNQNSGSTFGMRSFGRPFFGLFGACSAIGEGMSLGAMLIDGGFADYVIANASSHFCGAEKTFRFPLELGTQRPPTASWTVTGDGAVVLAARGEGPYITAVTTGAIVDMGVTDANNMGAAMAPAAADTLITHFKDLHIQPGHYDKIITGDLGKIGQDLLLALMTDAGYDLRDVHEDCGLLIYDRQGQDVHAGGSGCGCSAAVFAGYLLNQLRKKEIKRLLFIPTGALHSVATVQQGETMPAIAHAVAIEA